MATGFISDSVVLCTVLCLFLQYMSLGERNGLPCLKWCPPEDAAAQDLGGERCIIYEEKSRYQNRLEGPHLQSHNVLEVCLSEGEISATWKM